MIKRNNILIFSLVVFLMLLVSTGCRNDIVSPRNFAKFMVNVDNGLTHDIVKGDYKFRLKYLPIEGEALRNVTNSLTKESYQSALTKFQGHLYFSLTVLMKDGTNIKERLSDFSEEEMNDVRFHLKDDFKLYINDQNISCKLYHFEEMALAGYGVKLYLVFKDDIESRDNNIEFVFDDRYFSKESIAVTFDKEYLQKIPKVKI